MEKNIVGIEVSKEELANALADLLLMSAPSPDVPPSMVETARANAARILDAAMPAKRKYEATNA